jgi:hypothetical protein
MDFKGFRPLHGWRVFAGEVGVIVLGVLLALAAQQLAERIQVNRDARALRQTIDHEIGLNLFAYDVRARQFKCTARHIAELTAWLDRARTGAEVPAINATPPGAITPYRSAWDTRDSSVFNHLPAKVRQKYAEFYDELSGNWALMQQEQDTWIRLLPYAEPGPISLADRRTIRPILRIADRYNRVLQSNYPVSRKLAQDLGIKSVQPDDVPLNLLAHVDDCPSFVGTPA